MWALRSDPTEMIAASAPESSVRRRTYYCAFTGSSSKRRTAEMSSAKPGISS